VTLKQRYFHRSMSSLDQPQDHHGSAAVESKVEGAQNTIAAGASQVENQGTSETQSVQGQSETGSTNLKMMSASEEPIPGSTNSNNMNNPSGHINMFSNMQQQMGLPMQQRGAPNGVANVNMHQGQQNHLMNQFGIPPFGQGGYRPPHHHANPAPPFNARSPYMGPPQNYPGGPPGNMNMPSHSHDNRMAPQFRPPNQFGQQFSFQGMPPHHPGHPVHSPQGGTGQGPVPVPVPVPQPSSAGNLPTNVQQQEELRRRQMQAGSSNMGNTNPFHNPANSMNPFFNPRGAPPPLRPPGFPFSGFPMMNIPSMTGAGGGGLPGNSANPQNIPTQPSNSLDYNHPMDNSQDQPGASSPSKSMAAVNMHGMGMQWPPPDDKEYSLSEIINSLTTGNRLSPESARGRGRGRPKGTGRGAGRGGRGGKAKGIMSLTKTGPDGTIVPIHSGMLGDENGNSPVWYSGCVPLGLEEDQFWLSELQVYLRSNFAEAFGATELDITAPMHGRNKPIALGQVGIRCMYCKHLPPMERGQQAVSYPSLISGIYNSVQQMFRLHFDCCTSIPEECREKIETLRASSSSRGGRKQYWIDSAIRLGLVDTPHGIHFARDPSGPLPPIDSISGMKLYHDDGDEEDDEGSPTKYPIFLTQEHSDEIKRQKEEAYPLVLPEDKELISDYLFLTLEQMEPCKLMEADKVGCYKGREIGFRGLACKWCVGQAGCGRYFPASEASLSQTTTSQTVLNHVRNCRRCPLEIRDQLELMRGSKFGSDGKKQDKPKHGGRKVFFHRLWCRIQCVPMDKFEDMEAKIGRQKGAKNRKTLLGLTSKKRKNRMQSYSSDSSSESDSEDNTETEDEEERINSERKKKKSSNMSRIKVSGDDESNEEESVEPEDSSSIIHGCVPLSKKDDSKWLSSLMCFVRSDMVEMFSVDQDEVEEEDVLVGQVGVRCTFCAKLPLDERPDGHAYFPSSLLTIYQSVSDLQRRHFMSCSELSDEAKKSFKSLQGFGAKAEGETQQYWIDSARELGVANMENNIPGIRFYRNPEKESPADMVEKERRSSPKKKSQTADDDLTCLVRPIDEGTDVLYLLMKQVRPCRFKNSDRRGGGGSKGKDRALGFPGLACRHCASKNNLGRFFPMSSKVMMDTTTNQLLSHIQSCAKCPESIKSSLAYLSHREKLQSEGMDSKWKMNFFKLIWERLHVSREWSKVKNDGEEEGQEYEDDSDEMEGNDNDPEEDDSEDNEGEDGGEDEVDDMVKAAAQWLTKRDPPPSSSNSEMPKSKGRGLPMRKTL